MKFSFIPVLLVLSLVALVTSYSYGLRCRNDADCQEALGKKCAAPRAECRCLYWAFCAHKTRCNPENGGNDCYGSECSFDLVFDGYYCKD
ncbi:unnamed protein product, partial [Mesorhabditis belari]|uniref:Uncharacterized protein n=1 Tax=Mesorhabditis belari TaxID=2138241 RepID=A0AAF3EXM1_9BILA